jgi:UDP-glucose 4-epimerase
VKDCVEAIVRLISTDKAVGEVVNIGTDKEISMEALARMVKQRAAASSPIVYVSYEEAYEPGFEDMPRRVPSLEKLQRLTGFRPTKALPEIVDGVIEYHQQKREELIPAVIGGHSRLEPEMESGRMLS